MKALLEFGPLLAFFILNKTHGIQVATGAFMVMIVIALSISWKRERKLPIMPLITAAFVMVFGGLTLYFDDETFIQLKPTIASVFFAIAIMAGLMRGKLVLKSLLGSAMPLDDIGWQIMSKRWAGFFMALAIANEYVRYEYTLDQWVTFKTFGILPLTFVFAFSQFGVMQRHGIDQEEPNS